MSGKRDLQELAFLWIVLAGFLVGLGLLFFLIATDLSS